MIGGKKYKMIEYNKSIGYQRDLMKIGKKQVERFLVKYVNKWVENILMFRIKINLKDC